jgi:hypothetical protein
LGVGWKMAVLGALPPSFHIRILIKALKKVYLALAAYMWGRLTCVFFLVSVKLCFYYSLSVESTQKTPKSPFLGFPRALYRNSAQVRKNSPVRRRPSKYPWGGTTKKRHAGHFRETFLGGRGGGRRGKNTQERTTAPHALPHVDKADERA